MKWKKDSPKYIQACVNIFAFVAPIEIVGYWVTGDLTHGLTAIFAIGMIIFAIVVWKEGETP